MRLRNNIISVEKLKIIYSILFFIESTVYQLFTMELLLFQFSLHIHSESNAYYMNIHMKNYINFIE